MEEKQEKGDDENYLWATSPFTSQLCHAPC